MMNLVIFDEFTVIVFMFIIITTVYFVFTNYLIFRINKLKEKISLLEVDTNFLLNFMGIKKDDDYKE